MAKYSAIIIAAIFLLGAMGTPSMADEAGSGAGGVAWVDLPRVMKEYPRASEMVAEFEKDKAEMEAEVQKMIDEIERMEGEMLLLSEKARAVRTEEVLKRKLAVNMKIEESERRLSLQSMTRQANLLEEISGAAEKVARREGYAFVLRKEVLLYQDPAREITDLVIAELSRSDNRETGD